MSVINPDNNKEVTLNSFQAFAEKSKRIFRPYYVDNPNEYDYCIVKTNIPWQAEFKCLLSVSGLNAEEKGTVSSMSAWYKQPATGAMLNFAEEGISMACIFKNEEDCVSVALKTTSTAHFLNVDLAIINTLTHQITPAVNKKYNHIIDAEFVEEFDWEEHSPRLVFLTADEIDPEDPDQGDALPIVSNLDLVSHPTFNIKYGPKDSDISTFPDVNTFDAILKAHQLDRPITISLTGHVTGTVETSLNDNIEIQTEIDINESEQFIQAALLQWWESLEGEIVAPATQNDYGTIKLGIPDIADTSKLPVFLDSDGHAYVRMPPVQVNITGLVQLDNLPDYTADIKDGQIVEYVGPDGNYNHGWFYEASYTGGETTDPIAFYIVKAFLPEAVGSGEASYTWSLRSDESTESQIAYFNKLSDLFETYPYEIGSDTEKFFYYTVNAESQMLNPTGKAEGQSYAAWMTSLIADLLGVEETEVLEYAEMTIVQTRIVEPSYPVSWTPIDFSGGSSELSKYYLHHLTETAVIKNRATEPTWGENTWSASDYNPNNFNIGDWGFAKNKFQYASNGGIFTHDTPSLLFRSDNSADNILSIYNGTSDETDFNTYLSINKRPLLSATSNETVLYNVLPVKVVPKVSLATVSNILSTLSTEILFVYWLDDGGSSPVPSDGYDTLVYCNDLGGSSYYLRLAKQITADMVDPNDTSKLLDYTLDTSSALIGKLVGYHIVNETNPPISIADRYAKDYKNVQPILSGGMDPDLDAAYTELRVNGRPLLSAGIGDLQSAPFAKDIYQNYDNNNVNHYFLLRNGAGIPIMIQESNQTDGHLRICDKNGKEIMEVGDGNLIFCNGMDFRHRPDSNTYPSDNRAIAVEDTFQVKQKTAVNSQFLVDFDVQYPPLCSEIYIVGYNGTFRDKSNAVAYLKASAMTITRNPGNNPTWNIAATVSDDITDGEWVPYTSGDTSQITNVIACFKVTRDVSSDY